ncbi:ApeA N-terminal domain 1-containing protein [Micromonospora zhanjiangensis]|uniref:HEPN domain-containing protein n=1 Tax=Micromonospora zhanjiangensis TaxID=1522057 RepID=A0ABV8KWI0_9ACTN
METLETAGHWWMLGEPGRRVPGILKFDLTSGGRLTLIGGLRRPEDLAVPERMADGSTRISISEDLIARSGNYGRLHGECNGRAYTLEGCFQLRSRGGVFGPSYEEAIYVNHVYEGVWFSEGEPVGGNQLNFALDGLTEWVPQSGIVQVFNDGAVVDAPQVELHASRLPQRTVALPDGGELWLSHGLSTSSPGSSAALTENFSLAIHYERVIPIEDLLDKASDLQDLVSIATDRSAQYGTIRVMHPDLVEDRGGRRRNESFTVWSAWTALRKDDAKPLDRHSLFFTLDDIGGVAGLASWMQVTEKFRSALGRAMATKYAEKMYVSDRFLNRAAALEGFDRIKTGQSRGRTFVERISECISIAGAQFAELVCDPGKWATELKNHRNEIAHHYGRRMRQAVEDQLYISDSAFWLLVFCLLREAGIEDAMFDKILSHQKLQYLKRKNQSIFG